MNLNYGIKSSALAFADMDTESFRLCPSFFLVHIIKASGHSAFFWCAERRMGLLLAACCWGCQERLCCEVLRRRCGGSRRATTTLMTSAIHLVSRDSKKWARVLLPGSLLIAWILETVTAGAVSTAAGRPCPSAQYHNLDKLASASLPSCSPPKFAACVRYWPLDGTYFGRSYCLISELECSASTMYQQRYQFDLDLHYCVGWSSRGYSVVFSRHCNPWPRWEGRIWRTSCLDQTDSYTWSCLLPGWAKLASAAIAHAAFTAQKFHSCVTGSASGSVSVC